jgi:hypothetical protein
MTTTPTSTAVAPVEPVFTEPERLALAGFLAGYTGLTREAYTLDLRQYASWCQQHHIRLFQARRADIECFARDLGARGRARATITRRLCTIAGFYKYAVEEDLLEHSPAAHVRRPRLDYESHATGLDRNELGALLVAAGLGQPAEHALISLLRSTGCVSPKPPAPTSRPWASSAGTAPWSSPARAARSSPSRSPRAPPTGGRTGWVRALTAVLARRLEGQTCGVRALAAVPLPGGQTLLASGGTYGVVRLWDPAAGRPAGPPLRGGRTGGVRALAAVPLPSGQTLLASGGDDLTVRLCDPVNGRLVARIAHLAPVLTLLGWNGSLLAIGSADGLTVIDLASLPRPSRDSQQTDITEQHR